MKNTLTYKHCARYLNIETREGHKMSIDLGNPTGEVREFNTDGNSIKIAFLSEEKHI